MIGYRQIGAIWLLAFRRRGARPQPFSNSRQAARVGAPYEKIYHVREHTASRRALGPYAGMPRTGVGRRKFQMLTAAMLRRLLIAAAVLSMSVFFAAEGFATANARAVARSKPAPSMSGGWIYG